MASKSKTLKGIAITGTIGSTVVDGVEGIFCTGLEGAQVRLVFRTGNRKDGFTDTIPAPGKYTVTGRGAQAAKVWADALKGLGYEFALPGNESEYPCKMNVGVSKEVMAKIDALVDEKTSKSDIVRAALAAYLS